MCCSENQHDLLHSKLNEILSSYGRKSSNLIAILQDAQDAFGYLSKDVLLKIAKSLKIHPAEVFGVVTFYAQFRLKPIGKNHVVVCQGTACHVNGADNIISALEDELGVSLGEMTPDGLFTLESVACLGCCSLAPVMKINEEVYGQLTPNEARKIIRTMRQTNEANYVQKEALAN